MRIRAAAPGPHRTWEVVAPPGTTVGALAAAAGLPRAGHYALGGRAVAAASTLEQAGVRDGALLAPLGERPAPAAVALVVADGPRAGTVWALAPGRHVIGRHPSVDVLLDDPDVGARHAELCVGADGFCSVRDHRSATGTWLGGRRIDHAVVLDHGTELRIGATTLRLEDCTRAARALWPAGTPSAGPAPGPATRVRHRPPRRLPPPPPPRPEPPVAPAPPPAAASARTLLSMLVPSLAGLVVAAALRPSLLPLAAVAPAGALATWLVLWLLDRRAAHRVRRAHAARLAEHAASLAARERAVARHLVARHPDLGELACRIRRDDERLWERRPHHDDFLLVAPGTTAGVPVEVDLRAPLGIVGDPATTRAVARALLVQLAAHHGPADLAIEVWTEHLDAWTWTRWLPHAGTPAADARRLLLVDLDALPPTRRSAWRAHLGATGNAVVLASDRRALPEECATVLELGTTGARLVLADGDVRDVERVRTVGADVAEDLAAALAPYRDPDATVGGRALPAHVGLLGLVGVDPHGAPVDDLLARWSTTRAAHEWRTPLGVTAEAPLLLDLVADGPHALVAGTTGSGKSELLRALVASLAATADAERVAFVLVDYKGGSAFDGLAALPHVVDVVTDLDGATARRAITGLEAEIHRRERVLREHGAADIAALHRAPGPRPALPRVVIVVDEFATLAQDLPEFVDALVDVAQRGRSLGVHLVLATQRPSGAVKDAIRTNTNVRIALRVLDATDSRDVLGVDAAAAIDRDACGRAFVRLGPGALEAFQCVHVGARVDTAPVRTLQLVPVDAGAPARGDATPGERRELEVLVEAACAAHRRGGFATPRRPWTDPLPAHLPLAGIVTSAGDADDGLAFALADDPEHARHTVVRWAPRSGNLLVAGMPGSGTTTALRAIVAASLCAPAAERPDVYVVATATAAFDDLAAHPALGAVIAVDDDERVRRVLRVLGARITAARNGTARAVTRPALLVIDGIGTLRAMHDSLAGLDVLDALERVAADGPASGVHLACSAEHPAAVGHRIDRTLAHRVVLRLADRGDVRTPGTAFDPQTFPPGRGVDLRDGRLVQVACDAAPPADDRAVPAAPRVGTLPEHVDARTLPPVRVDGHVVHVPLGIDDDALAPVGVVLGPHDHLLVTGPARSGRTTLLDAVAARAAEAGVHVVRIAPPRGARPDVLTGRDDIVATCEELLATASSGPVLVLVDDADQVDDGGVLERLVLAPHHVASVLATVRNDRLRGLFRHWTGELRRNGLGVLLRADDADGELLGVRLPRGAAPRTPGRGWLVRDGEVVRVQFAQHGTAPR